MDNKFSIKPPFFEIGPKAYLFGDEAFEFILKADEIALHYDIDIIFTAQYSDIYRLSKAVKRILIFAQHMDPIEIGRGIGAVLPEAIKAAGARGTLLNHSEKRISLSDIGKTIKRADDLELATLVCADNVDEAKAIAQFSPNMILLESPDNIGKRNLFIDRVKEISYAKKSIEKINPQIKIMHGAGIQDASDVYEIIKLGAEGTGSTSGIFKSENPITQLDEMISALRQSWEKLEKE